MKQILYVLLLSIHFFAHGAEDISGIGDLKIGMSESDFLSLQVIAQKTPSEKIYKTTNYKNILDNEEGDLWVITSESDVKDEDKVFSTDIVKYEFRYPIRLNENQTVNYKAKAIFYKKRLVEVSLSNMNYLTFKKLLTEKYGPGVEENKTKTVICQNDYGSRLEMFEGTIKTVWGRGKKITSDLQQTMNNCKLGPSSYAVIDKQATMNIKQSESEKMKKLLNERKKERISNSGL